jgi:Mn2+/Fe2+ NRAMP family transporter
VSFIRTLRPAWNRHASPMIIGFIVVSAMIFLAVGRPVAVLIAVGALNGLILPIGLGAILVASRRPALLNGYTHARSLTAAGAAVALTMAALGVYTLVTQIPQLLR